MIVHSDAKEYDVASMCGTGKRGRYYQDDGAGHIVATTQADPLGGGDGGDGSEAAPMLSEGLPGWAVTPHPRIERRSKLKGSLFGHAPNKQHELFLFEERGHDS